MSNNQPIPSGLIPGRMILFLTGWTLLNLLQAAFTELNPDEAYYRLYSEQLAWGYFDHPPAIALMIRLGSAWLPGELGVRLWTVLLSTAGLGLLWDLMGRPRAGMPLNTFMLLAVAMPFFHVYGFVATPDSPLLFFSLLFYVIFRRVLDRPHDGRWWLALGTCMAALLYSKYHGVLVIALAILSQPALLGNYRLYLASLWGAFLFAPHLYWQFEEGFPSFRYHLLERNNPFQPKHLVAYLTNQLVIFNPLLFPLLAVALYREARRLLQPSARMARTYVGTIIGFWLFFLATVVRGHVEPQWTAVLSIPFAVLAYRESIRHPTFQRWLRRLVLAALLLLVLARVAILKGVLEERLPLFHERHWTFALEEAVGDHPVVFQNAYREPSMYRFYAGQAAYSDYTVGARRANQFNVWNWQPELQGRRVAMVRNGFARCPSCRQLDLGQVHFRLRWLPAYPVVPKLDLAGEPGLADWNIGEERRVRVVLSNPYADTAWLMQGPLPLRAVALLRKPRLEEHPSASALAEALGPNALISQRAAFPNWFFTPARIDRRMLPPGGRVETTLTFRVPDDWADGGQVGFSLQLGALDPFMPSQLFSWPAVDEGSSEQAVD